MKTKDLYVEFWAAIEQFKGSPAVARRLDDQGMTEISMRISEPGPIGCCHVSEGNEGYYEPGREGRGPLMLIIPCYEMQGTERTLVDLVAVNPNSPTQWAQRTGHAVMLGWNRMIQAGVDSAPLSLCETPLQYLLSNGTKVCPLDLANLPLFVQDFKEIRTDDTAFGKKVEAALHPKPLTPPSVRVRHARP